MSNLDDDFEDQDDDMENLEEEPMEGDSDMVSFFGSSRFLDESLVKSISPASDLSGRLPEIVETLALVISFFKEKRKKEKRGTNEIFRTLTVNNMY